MLVTLYRRSAVDTLFHDWLSRCMNCGCMYVLCTLPPRRLAVSPVPHRVMPLEQRRTVLQNPSKSSSTESTSHNEFSKISPKILIKIGLSFHENLTTNISSIVLLMKMFGNYLVHVVRVILKDYYFLTPIGTVS